MAKRERANVLGVVLVGDQEEQVHLEFAQDLFDLFRRRWALDLRHILRRRDLQDIAHHFAWRAEDQDAITEAARLILGPFLSVTIRRASIGPQSAALFRLGDGYVVRFRVSPDLLACAFLVSLAGVDDLLAPTELRPDDRVAADRAL
jgi:hypothetical protein